VPVVHRLALYDDAESIVNIISQTDIVKFLDANRGQLGPLAKKTVQQLGWYPKQVPRRRGRRGRRRAAVGLIPATPAAAFFPGRVRASTPLAACPPQLARPPPHPPAAPNLPPQVIAVTPDVSAIEAMALMNEKHISAVAVVDSVGKIIGGCALVKSGSNAGQTKAKCAARRGHAKDPASTLFYSLGRICSTPLAPFPPRQLLRQ
jgi:CBS domain-containing protein